MTHGTVLVLGATGGLGGTLARNLAKRGWKVRALHRKASTMQGRDGFEWVQGDAMNRDEVVAAARGCTVIVHAVNPPGYRNWHKLVLPMIDNTIAAARESGARIMLPGNIYNFDPQDATVLPETTPQRAKTRKGRIRVEMEKRLRQSALPVLIVRAGDFFGPGAEGSWFSQVVAKAGKPLTKISLPGRPGVGHQWAYLPDLADTTAMLLERGNTETFEVYHFGGHWDGDGQRIAQAIKSATNRPDLPVGQFPWVLVWLAAPFVTMFREVLEMRYLWSTPLRMTNDKLVSVLGSEPHTPLVEAVRLTLQHTGCLPDPATPYPNA